MAISLRAASAWAAGAGTPNGPATPAGTTAGDMVLAYIGLKPFSVTPTIASPYAEVSGCKGTNGSVASGVDTGSVSWMVGWRIFQAGDANPSFSIAGVNVLLCVAISFQRSAGTGWETPVGAKGSDTTSGTGFSLATDADPGITAGDMLATFATLPGDNATFGTPTITATSATIGTVTETPATEGTTATGNDLESSASIALCTAGTASANPAVGWTLSAAQTGGGCLVRLREATAAAEVIPDLVVARY